jgi:ABC-type Fe3+/spermidine/putrescine transport system ATPase subunit
MVLADVMAIIHEGVIRQIGEPQDVFAYPADAWVAAFLGMQVLCPDQLRSADHGRVWVGIGQGNLEATAKVPFSPDNARLVFRPEDVHLERLNGQFVGTAGMLLARVEEVVPLGLLFRIELNIGVPFIALLSRQECQRLGLKAGDQVVASFDPNHLLLVPDDQRVC